MLVIRWAVDVGQSALSLPGTLAASVIEHTVEPDARTVQQKAPLVYFYGHTTPSKAPELYKQMLSRLAEDVGERLERAEPRERGHYSGFLG